MNSRAAMSFNSVFNWQVNQGMTKSYDYMQKIFQAFRQVLMHFMPILAIFTSLPSVAETAAMPRVIVQASLSSPSFPVILRGSKLALLLGVSLSRIHAMANHGSASEAIPFQIDQRDTKGRYVLTASDAGSNPKLDVHDECVFMVSDAGNRVTTIPERTAIEIVIMDPKTKEQKWVYLVETKTAQTLPASRKHHVAYDPTRNTIETDTYRIEFSTATPFLIDSLQWHTDDPNKWSPNLVDTMKVRHYGKLFGNIDFTRTQADYKSRVVAVKDGPVRVIRRTLNSVRVIWYLQSPSVTIDYVAYANGFTMDTTIDFPFPLRWFFSDVSTLTTIDWNDDPSLPGLRIYGADMRNGVAVNGRMTPEKEQFNKIAGQRFAIENSYGLILTDLEIEKNLPIVSHLYLHDERSQVDEPENIPGQFGNVGFMTIGWEKIGTSIHHLMFNVILLPKLTIEQGVKVLGDNPWKNTAEAL
jgi:hypothetical protein